MSPLSTFHSCGSSSSRVLRMKRPIGVMRVSCFCAHTAPVFASASARHRAELVDREQPTVLADARLVIEHRARRRQADRERGHAR